MLNLLLSLDELLDTAVRVKQVHLICSRSDRLVDSGSIYKAFNGAICCGYVEPCVCDYELFDIHMFI